MVGRWRGVMLLLAVLTLAACSRNDKGSTAAVATTPDATLPVARIAPNAVRTEPAALRVEVADTDELRFCGLMHRRSMPDEQGMLFVFEGDQGGPFWNRNTFIPLTLAWIDAGGRVVELTELPAVKPEDNPQVNVYSGPKIPYRYVIEANQGWYARHQVAIGDRVDLQEALTRGSGGAVPICREKGL